LSPSSIQISEKKLIGKVFCNRSGVWEHHLNAL
jgi:hypothetical protein